MRFGDKGSGAVHWDLGNVVGHLPGVRQWPTLSTWDVCFVSLDTWELMGGECGYSAPWVWSRAIARHPF